MQTANNLAQYNQFSWYQAYVICELLAVKHGDLELDLFSNSV